MILPLYFAVVRAHLKCCTRLWGPQHENNMNLFEQFQKKTTKMICRLEHLSYTDRLREVWFFSLEKISSENLLWPSGT